MTRLLPLTKGYVALIDEEVEQGCRLYKWHACKTANHVYGRAVDPFDNRKTFFLHRHIARAPDGVHVDHINGNTLDNRLDNLRWCTNRQNSANQRKRKVGETSSRYKGVHWNKRQSIWVASIHVDYGTQFIGHFKDEADAARAYDAAAREAFGSFARTNF